MRFAFLRNTTAFAAALIGTALLGGTAPVIGASITYSDPACESFAIEGSNGNFTLRCVAVQGPSNPGAPAGCVPSISTNPSPLTKDGGAVTLNVSSCSSASPLTYSWSRNGSAGWSTGQSASDTLAANTGATGVTNTYQARVCIEGTSTCTNLSSLTATVPGTGVVAGGISCAAQGFAKTLFYNWDWAQRQSFVQTYNDPQGPVGNNGIVVIAFKPSAMTGNASITISEYPANSTNPLGITRTLSISEQPCDLSGASVPNGTRVGYNGAKQFTVLPVSTWSLPRLTAGKQYYLNIANRNAAGQGTCAGQCEFRVESSHP